ncbi:MAG: 3-oxoacyl-[acyl-carrier-protein] synthase III C-terminal domain-containing protein, partial [Longimicrobiales bacterium]
MSGPGRRAPVVEPRRRTDASLAAIRYAFPEGIRTLPELAAAGALRSDPAVLAGFGFEHVRVAVDESPYTLASRAATSLLEATGVDPASIDLLIYGGAPGPLAFAAAAMPQSVPVLRGTDRFLFPASRLQHELGLVRATTLGLDQLACTTLFAAVRIARALIGAEGLGRALCVSAEFSPPDAGREHIYNCTSDAACAVLVERGGARNRIVAGRTVTKGYYWRTDALQEQIVASYFPTAKHVVERTLADAGWDAADVDWVIPHNVSRRSWQLLLGLLRLPNARLWDRNIARDGHTLAGDNFINLADALEAGALEAGARVLLFSYGYGAHWT